MTNSTSSPASRRRAALALAAVGAVGLSGLGLTPANAAPAYTWQRVYTGALQQFSSPAVLKTATQTLVVVADRSGNLTAVDGSGNQKWRKPIVVSGAATPSVGSPAIGDINGDGRDDIVVGAGSIWPGENTKHGGVVAFDADGNRLWGYQTRDKIDALNMGSTVGDGFTDPVLGAPAIGDVDGDGTNEVVFGAADHQVHVLTGATGKSRYTPYDSWDTIFSTPSLVQMDADPGMEIVIGGDATQNAGIKWTARGVLRALKPNLDGTLKQKWVRQFQDVVPGAPVVTDINSDGKQDVVFSTGGFYYNHTDSRAVQAVDLATGANLAGFPSLVDSNLRTSVAVGDVNSDGKPEIVLGDSAGKLYAIRGNGARLWAKQWATSDNPQAQSVSLQGGGVSIGDLDGNGSQDIAVPDGFGGVTFVNGGTGNVMATKQAGGGRPYAIMAAPTFANFGSQGGRQLVTSGNFGPAGTVKEAAIVGLALPNTSAADAWPTFHGSFSRGGTSVDPLAKRNLKLAHALYLDMLAREGSPGEWQDWARKMSVGGRGVGSDGFKDSEEYRAVRLKYFYATVLGRSEVPKPAEIKSWQDQLKLGRTNLDKIPRDFMTSVEFFNQGGGTTAGFINLLYQRAAGRTATPAEVAQWTTVYNTKGKMAVINGIYDMPESAGVRVSRAYQSWFGRVARPDEQQHWTSAVISTGDEGMRRIVMTSDEYANRAQTR